MKRFSLSLIVVLLIRIFTVSAQDTANRPAITLDNAASVTQLGVLDAGNVSVLSLAFSPDGKRLISGHADGIIKEWDLATGQSTSITSPAGSWVRAVIYSPDGTQIASADKDDVILWDANTQKQVSVLKGHTDEISVLAYSPDGHILASGSWDDSIRLWDVASGKVLQTLKAAATVEDIDFSPDGKTLASVDGNTAGVNLWDVASGKSLPGITTDQIYYTSLSFNMDGTLLAATGQDQVQVWDMKTQKLKYGLDGHKGNVDGLHFSPVNNILVSGGQDSTVRVWDVERGSGFSPLKGDFFEADTVAFSADGSLFATGGSDGLIHFWGTPDGGALPLPVPAMFTPKAGHWQGGDDEMEVSFDVGADGNINNFHLEWTLGTSTCTLDQSNTLTVEDNQFSFGPDVQHIEGQFRSATALFGRSDITQCGDMFVFTTGGPPTWWVKWASAS